MKAILICPDERAEVPLLGWETPLALAPALGFRVVEYWMSHLACAGFKQVLLLGTDRTEELRKVVSNGSRWGVAAEVIDNSEELTPEEAAQKFEALPAVMDHFPGFAEHPLFASYEQWFKALAAWMPHAKMPDRVGLRQRQPGVWMGLHGHVSSEARLEAPCWIGDHVYVGPRAIVGPETILENGSFIESDAKISSSIIGPATFVGRYMRISNGLAWGSTLVDWQTGRQDTVSHTFLLCSLRPQRGGTRAIPWLDRIAEWLSHWNEDEPTESLPFWPKKEADQAMQSLSTSFKGAALPVADEVTRRISR